MQEETILEWEKETPELVQESDPQSCISSHSHGHLCFPAHLQANTWAIKAGLWPKLGLEFEDLGGKIKAVKNSPKLYLAMVKVKY